MQQLRTFITQSLLGGLLVVLPLVIFGLLFNWIFTSIAELISPLTQYVLSRYSAPEWLVDIAVMLMILFCCFVIGGIISTGGGRWLHNQFEKLVVRTAPGYSLIKDIVQQLFGDKADSPLRKGDVALVRAFGLENTTAMTGIISAHHANGWFTVFVPTGPNPTTGFIFHVAPEQVQLLPQAKTDITIKSIIACGSGSQQIPGLTAALTQFPCKARDDEQSSS
jgi:uncharacterized membrane protein